MSRRSGSADLPLHSGRVPPWLGERMTRLGRVLVEAIVLHYGRDELLRRLAHPFWFQSFGAVMGMDWHSSGITTSVMGALKRGLAPLERGRRRALPAATSGAGPPAALTGHLAMTAATAGGACRCRPSLARRLPSKRGRRVISR